MTCATNFPLTDIALLLRDQINAELIGAVPLDKLDEEVISLVQPKFDLVQEQLNKLVPEKHIVSQNLEGTTLETTLNNGDVFLTDLSTLFAKFDGLLSLYGKNVEAGAGAGAYGWVATLIIDGDKTQAQINAAQKLKNEQYVNVKDFGAKGDGATDDSKAINDANNFAKQNKKSLYFPSGTYLGNNLKPTTSWVGDGVANTRVKHNAPTTAFTNFVVGTGVVSGSVFDGITFDGSVSADPTTWSNTNYNSFTGAIAFGLSYSNNIYFSNCNFENSFWSNVRVEGCENVFFSNCNAKKARGNFGDGYYFASSKNIHTLNCQAEDFTRIGFVREQNTYNCNTINCHAKNGHDASIAYGGGEYNAGFWQENATNSETISCTATDITHYGFICATGNKLTDTTNAYNHSLNSCTAKNCNYGFVLQSFVGTPVLSKIKDCKAFNCTYPANITSNNASDIFIIDDCILNIDWQRQSANLIKGLIITGATRCKVKIRNTLFSRKNAVASDLTNKAIYIADILTYGATTRIDVEIVNCYTDDGSAVVFKQIDVGSKLGLKVKNTKIDLRKVAAIDSHFDVNDCDVVFADFVNSSTSVFNNCRLLGNCTMAISDLLTLNNCSFDTQVLTDTLSITTGISTKKHLVKISGGKISKNITDGDYAIKLQYEGALKPITTVTDVTLENKSDTATSSKNFIWLVRSPDTVQQSVVGNNNVLYRNVIADANVTYVQKTNTSNVTVSDVVAATMH